MSNQASTRAVERNIVRIVLPSKLARLEGVALVDAAALQAALEPGDTLCAGAVGEALGHDRALRAALQGVVADLRRRVQRLFDVALLEDLARRLRVVTPDAGKAVGLQLQAHADGVLLRLAGAPAQVLDALGDAHQLLHMVA